jgi:hypothetical protein
MIIYTLFLSYTTYPNASNQTKSWVCKQATKHHTLACIRPGYRESSSFHARPLSVHRGRDLSAGAALFPPRRASAGPTPYTCLLSSTHAHATLYWRWPPQPCRRSPLLCPVAPSRSPLPPGRYPDQGRAFLGPTETLRNPRAPLCRLLASHRTTSPPARLSPSAAP